MLQAEQATRQRMGLLLVVIGTLLGTMMVSGLIERFTQARAAIEAPPDPAEMKRFAAEARKVRALRDQIATLGEKHDWNSAAAAADRYLATNDNSSMRFLRGEANWRRGKYEVASEDFATLFTASDAVSRADILALRGDKDAYQKLCSTVLDAADPAKLDSQQANNTAWVAALAPDGLTDYTKAIQLAEKGAAIPDPTSHANFLNTLGAVLQRAGRSKEARERLLESERLLQDKRIGDGERQTSAPFNWAFLALACQKEGRTEEARHWRDRLGKRLNETYGRLNAGQNRHELLAFWREIEQTVR